MAKRKKQFAAATQMSTFSPQSTIPAISVIIPMYNAEEFIGECLDSLLLQTFQDFEVVIVDDCSSDNSVKIVESYREKFGERLTISKTETNSGGGGYVPRNIGLGLAGGKYVFFMDADDFILLNALETLYTAAKEYDADVVYIASYYWLKKPNSVSLQRDLTGDELLAQGLEDKPTLIVDAPDKVLPEVLLKNHHRTPWAKLIQRELLTENNILFPEIILGGDVLWSFLVYANSKRFLRLPTPLYFLRRYHTTSIIKTKRSIEGYFPERNAGFIAWFKVLNSLAGKAGFFKENVDLCCEAAKNFFEYFVRGLYEEDKRLCLHDIRDILLNEKLTESDAVDLTTPFLNLMEEFDKRCPLSTIAVSVIISLYNYGKYVGECLDSLLEQTFQDFEIIVVDDCSTDNGVEVVESYAPKFNGRLKLTRTEKNSGGGGLPRNLGLSLANGEYVFFMDADDALVPTALEEMHALAKEYYADVVYCEKYFTSEGVGQEFKDNVRIADIKCQKPPFAKEVTLEIRDMIARINRAVKFNYWVTAWLRFVRRDFLIENDIKFLSLIGSNDVGWSYQVLFCSRRLLRVPNAYYIRRVHDESVSFRKREVPEHVHKWMDRTIRSLRYMSDFMEKIEFFRENPKFRHKVLSHFVDSDFACIVEECKDLEPFEVAEIFRQKFGDYLGEHDVLVSLLCANVNTKLKRIRRIEQNIAELTENTRIITSKGYPAISVIIPMYNAEKYISGCLFSLLAQSFKNFEIIVVDDCSTDKSFQVVEEYAPKFKGRLRLLKTKKNSDGGGYVPRNMGLRFAQGKYIFFADADDLILLSGLKTLYDAAIKYDADVVCTTAYYDLTSRTSVQKVTDDMTKKSFAGNLNGSPNLLINAPNKNMRSLLFSETMPACWRKLIRREFLIANQILFPEISDDAGFIWTMNLYCNASRILRISNPLYFYRSYSPNSFLRQKRRTAEQIFYRVSSLVSWARSLNELAQENDVFKKHPEYSHRALTLKFNQCIKDLSTDLNRLYYKDIYELMCRELGKTNNPSDLTTMAFIFSNIILDRRRYLILEKHAAELESELEKLKEKE